MSRKMYEEVREAYNAVDDLYKQKEKERAKRAWSNGVLWVLMRLEDGESFDAIATKALEFEADLSALRWRHPASEEWEE